MKVCRLIPDLTKEEINRFLIKVEKKSVNECWMWLGCVQKGGRGLITIRGIAYKAPRIAYYLANNADPHDLCVLHRCDNPNCVNPRHLFLGTLQDNVKDKVTKCRQARGQNIKASKLTDDQVKQILKSKGTHREIAHKYNIDHTIIGDIFRGQLWKHVARENYAS